MPTFKGRAPGQTARRWKRYSKRLKCISTESLRRRDVTPQRFRFQHFDLSHKWSNYLLWKSSSFLTKLGESRIFVSFFRVFFSFAVADVFSCGKTSECVWTGGERGLYKVYTNKARQKSWQTAIASRTISLQSKHKHLTRRIQSKKLYIDHMTWTITATHWSIVRYGRRWGSGV